MKHREATVLSRCGGELVFRRVIAFTDEPYREYRCNRCRKWVYIPEMDEKFQFETQIRI